MMATHQPEPVAREEENGVAPRENGTFGLLVPFRTTEPLSWKEVMKEPAKKRLASDEFVVMERTSDRAPVTPTKGGFDHKPDLISQRATDDPGDVKLPPAQIFPSFTSQNTVFTWPLGPPEPKAANAPDENA
jgi:hypothetical protein